MSKQPTSQADLWNGTSGTAWAREVDELDIRLAHLGHAAIEALAPRSGERILDVGCGAGATSRELARATGDHGHVTGIDISRPLLDVARARGGSVRYLEADASTATFDTMFDGIFSRLGIMFFEKPSEAFAHLKRAAPHRATRLCSAGADSKRTRGDVAADGDRARSAAAASAINPDAPGPFAFAVRDKIERTLRDAGWRSVSVTPHDSLYELGADPEIATKMALAIGPLSRAVREAPETHDAVREALLAGLAADAEGRSVTYPAATWIVTAR